MCICNNLNCEQRKNKYIGKMIKFNKRNFFICLKKLSAFSNKEYEVIDIKGELDDDVYSSMPQWWIDEYIQDIEELINE